MRYIIEAERYFCDIQKKVLVRRGHEEESVSWMGFKDEPNAAFHPKSAQIGSAVQSSETVQNTALSRLGSGPTCVVNRPMNSIECLFLQLIR